MVPAHVVFIVVHATYQVYQFFVHTRLSKRLGTSSTCWPHPATTGYTMAASRVKYLDKNYGGFLIALIAVCSAPSRPKRPPDYGVPGGR